MKIRTSILRYFELFSISIVIVILDQISKYIIRGTFQLYEVKPFIPHWNWILAYNKGAAFSFLANQNGWQKIPFMIISALVSLYLIYNILKKRLHLFVRVALSFILGGALGNLIDRVWFGQVTDFIDWYVGAYHWPAFNVADSFVVMGVTLLVIDSLFLETSKKK